MDTKKICTLADLKVWNFPGTALAVIGQPIKHSLSPIMQNAAIERLSQEDSNLKDGHIFVLRLTLKIFQKLWNYFIKRASLD